MLLLAACTNPDATQVDEPAPRPPRPGVSADWAPAPRVVGDLSTLARVEGEDLFLSTVGGDVGFVAGVNLGATVPNHAPGELALAREDYRRWFPMMADLGFRAIRIYTIHPPHFYEELVAYNAAHPTAPLYLIHGVWIPEEEFLAVRNLWDPAVVAGMKAEIDDVVAVVSGEAVIAPAPGHASGTYTADVTPWLYSWALGVEWDPNATVASDRANDGRAGFDGEYFENRGEPSSTEVWIAEMLDHLAGGLVDRGLSMPMTFVNWPTADPLVHPAEPLPEEDLVGVDANHVGATDAWPGGFYASYHAYPYYPDFQRYEPGIADATYNGQIDPYAGYLMALLEHHAGMPVMINEFGVPSAAALAHFGPLGRDQGDHSEQEAMAINAELMTMIHDLGFAGGYVFEWVDEWFKFTWNTIDYELPPGRRSLWMNPWTNEAHFGVVSIDPGDEPAVVVDGDDGEWRTNGSQVIYESPGGIRQVRALKDEGYLYLRLLVDGVDAWEVDPVVIGFDVLAGGRDGLPGQPDAPAGSDYAIVVDDGGARVWVRASTDQLAILYGSVRQYLDVDAADLAEGSGVWNPYELITNRPYVVPTTGEQRPAEVFSAGVLVRGTSDVAAPAYDSRAMWEASGRVIELRIPYQAIGISDPSSRSAYRVSPQGAVTAEPFDRVAIVVAHGGEVEATNGYSWEPWQAADWHERLKVGSEVLAAAMRAIEGLDK